MRGVLRRRRRRLPPRRTITGRVERIPAQTVLYLINAVWFKGSWKEPFDEQYTKPEDFRLPDGSKQQVPMMRRSDTFAYLENERFQAVRLRYGEAQRFSMYVFLPAEEVGLEGFFEGLDGEVWSGWMAGFGDRRGGLQMPRFRVEVGLTLNDALKALGMGVAFDSSKADLSGIAETSGTLYVDTVRHKVFIEVDEEGTEAAAATSVAVGLTAERPGAPFSMIVNRPFFCAIRDDVSGALLFVGTVVDPR